MDLSIIIINWNTRDLLRDCLNSVLEGAPDHRSFEIIVVDNASTDGSQDMVRNLFPQVTMVMNERNRGFAAANNQAIEIASGSNVLLLNSDTLVHGKVLAESLAYMDAHWHVGAMGCRVLNADGSLQHSTSQFPSLLNLTIQTLGLDRLRFVSAFRKYRMLDWDRRSERYVETISGCYLMVRRQCIEAVGKLDEAFFFFGEETDWCRRIREAGWKVAFAPVGDITHFGGGSSGTLNHKRDLMLSEATVRLHRKHSGWLTALGVYLLLFLFNSSRFVYWAFVSTLKRAHQARQRRVHFKGVSLGFLKAWPRIGRAFQ